MTQVAGQKKILVLGAHGQLGRAYLKLLKQEEPTAEIVGASHSDADLRRPENYLRYIEKIRPAVIFNAAAYTKVDLAESENELALEINAVAPGRIAEWCARQNVPFVHFSTDYVFPGSGEAPWLETDPVAPLNFYGRSKAEGEVRVTQARGHSLIFRTSWVYDSQGKNFLTTMLQLGKEREILRVVGDQIGAPTYAPDLALASYLALKKSLEMPNFSGGIFHLVNSGFTSWYEFKAIRGDPHSILRISHSG